MYTRLLNRVPLILLMIGLLTAVGVGQSRPASSTRGLPGVQDATASVSGTIVDSLNQAVQAAKVTVTNAELGLERTAQTNEEGYFFVPFLPPGTYTLLIEMTGFAAIRVSGLLLQSAMNSAVSLTLQPKGLKEIIDVTATQSGIDASNATIKYSIPVRQIEIFPMIATASGRSILYSLPLFLPGISPGFYVGIRGEGLVANGARPLANSFSIEGGDNNDYELNRAASPYPNPDALQEVTVLTNNYKADVGGAAGAVVDATVKPGTNRFHGNGRYFLSHPALNARSFFDRVKSPYVTNSEGGQIGGPALIPRLYNGRDRTHFFFDVENNYSAWGFDYLAETFPPAERAGDFRRLPPYDPANPFARHRPIDPLTGNPFPRGIIPQSRFDPIALYYLANLIPPPDDPSGRIAYNEIWWARNRQYTTRIDHVLSDKDDLTAVLFFNLQNYGGVQSRAEDSQHYDNRSHSQNLVLREAHSFSSNSVNEFSAAFVHLNEGSSAGLPAAIRKSPSQLGFTGVHPQDPALAILPSVSIYSGNTLATGASGIQGTESTKTTLAIKDDLVKASGRHTFKIGAGSRLFRFNRFDPWGANGSSQSGSFEFEDFNPYGTGNALADFLLGLPRHYQQATGLQQRPRQRTYSFYAMDDWRVLPNLTLNLGVRYELTPPLIDDLNQVMAFRPGAHSIRFPAAPAGMLFSGDPDPILGRVPRGGYATNFSDFAPRIGLAYSPAPRNKLAQALFGNGRSAIRAGFGMFHNPTYGHDFSRFSEVAPFSGFVSFDLDPDGTFANPFGKQQNPFPITPARIPSDFLRYPTIHAFDARFRTAYTYHYNLSIQRELRGSVLLELAYVGSNSFRLDREFDDNHYTTIPDYPFYSFTYPELGDVLLQKSSGRARYDALQVRLSRKFRGGLMIDVSYVLSKSLDNSSGPRYETYSYSFPAQDIAGISDPYTWARSEFDRRQNFVAFYAYDLPAFEGRGVRRLLLNRWQVGALTQLRSGSPMDILGSADNFRPDFVGPFERFDPRRVRTFVLNGTPVVGNFLFNPNAFKAPAGRLGNLGRNVFDGPGLNLTSLSIVKRNQIHESQEIQFRADITNLLNHANFVVSNLGNLQGGAYLGQVNSALPGRNVQLSIKYRF